LAGELHQLSDYTLAGGLLAVDRELIAQAAQKKNKNVKYAAVGALCHRDAGWLCCGSQQSSLTSSLVASP